MNTRTPLSAVIEATWFGSGLTPRALERLASIAADYERPAGAILLREGEEARELGLLIHGRLALAMRVQSRGAIDVAVIEPGDIFGWSAIVPPFRATSTVRVVERVSVVAFKAADLRALLHADENLAAAIYLQVVEAVARRLTATQRQLVGLYREEAAEPW